MRCARGALTFGRCLCRLFTRHCYIFPLCFFSAPHRPCSRPLGELVCRGCGIGHRGGVEASAVVCLPLGPPRILKIRGKNERQQTRLSAWCTHGAVSSFLENVESLNVSQTSPANERGEIALRKQQRSHGTRCNMKLLTTSPHLRSSAVTLRCTAQPPAGRCTTFSALSGVKGGHEDMSLSH